jgi:Eco57I restriction-modification methylase
MLYYIKMETTDLARCQVETPVPIVRLMWRMAHRQRPSIGRFPSVLDLGAGDGRFSRFGVYDRYVGVELDRAKVIRVVLPTSAQLRAGDAFKARGLGRAHSLAIGNPPYIRHHDLPEAWQARAINELERRIGVRLKLTANLYILFLALALTCVDDDGLVVQLVPFEWVTRPSASELREYAKSQGWGVRVFRFKDHVFPRVLTTASITVIDKRIRDGRWEYGEIDERLRLTLKRTATGSRRRPLAYEDGADDRHGIRGLSPGGQDIFVLTEEQRLSCSLQRDRDVRPCVTSLRLLPDDLPILDGNAFRTHFVMAGRPCWLIRSDRKNLSAALTAYLESIGDRWKAYSTCTGRSVWWRYIAHRVPDVLVASGFVGKAPKAVENRVRAIAVGAVYGVHLGGDLAPAALVRSLRSGNLAAQVVGHSNNLKKLEVRQLNNYLNQLTA